MGLFSYVEYNKRLPDGKVAENLATNDLEYRELWYLITAEGRLLRENDDCSFTDMNYTGLLYVYTPAGDDAYQFIFSEGGFLESVLTAK